MEHSLENTSLMQKQPRIGMQSEKIDADYFVTHFEEFIPRYIAKGNPSEDTLTHYNNQIRNFIRWCLKDSIHPLSVTEYQMRIFREWLVNQNYKAETIQHMLAAIRAFYLAAVKMHIIEENPVNDITAPTVYSNNDALLHFYTPEQINKVVQVFTQDEVAFTRYRNMLILYLMGVEGLRNIEVHRACLEDINWDVKAFMVRGKGSKGRIDPIYPCDDTFKLLEQYLASVPKDNSIKKDGMLTPLILSSSHRNYLGRISRNGIRSIMNKALTAANLKHAGLSCHIFRHSCGTNLYQATKDLRVVQETLRQRDPKVTARYAHVNRRLESRVTSALVPKDTSSSDI